jgi:hypothetical protein
MTQPVHLSQHEVNVTLLDGLVGDDASEEVGELTERLVADHDGPCGHHPALDLSSHIAQLPLPVGSSVLGKFPGSKAFRNVPEADVGALWLVVYQVELVGLLLHLLDLVGCQLQQPVNLLFESLHSL